MPLIYSEDVLPLSLRIASEQAIHGFKVTLVPEITNSRTRYVKYHQYLTAIVEYTRELPGGVSALSGSKVKKGASSIGLLKRQAN